MDIFGLSMESDVVEELALKLYEELDKLICDNDPMMFSNIICLISNTLEQLNNRIVREKELSEKLQVMRDENEELLRKFRNRGGIIEDKDRMILQYQSEIEAYHHDKELLISDAKIMKKRINDLNKKIKELEVLVDSFESENFYKEEKLKAMEKELERKVIRNTNFKNSYQQNYFNKTNSSGDNKTCVFAVLKRQFSDNFEDSNREVVSNSAANYYTPKISADFEQDVSRNLVSSKNNVEHHHTPQITDFDGEVISNKMVSSNNAVKNNHTHLLDSSKSNSVGNHHTPQINEEVISNSLVSTNNAENNSKNPDLNSSRTTPTSETTPTKNSNLNSSRTTITTETTPTRNSNLNSSGTTPTPETTPTKNSGLGSPIKLVIKSEGTADVGLFSADTTGKQSNSELEIETKVGDMGVLSISKPAEVEKSNPTGLETTPRPISKPSDVQQSNPTGLETTPRPFSKPADVQQSNPTGLETTPRPISKPADVQQSNPTGLETTPRPISKPADVQQSTPTGLETTPRPISKPVDVQQSNPTELETTTKVSKNGVISISIFADATGKEVSQLLKKHFSDNCNIMSLVKSNASFLQVVNSCRPETYTENDHVIFIFGVTDIDLRKECDIFLKLEPYLALFCKTNVWICTLPYRYDLKPDDTKQNVIQLINNYMKEIAVRQSHVRVIDIYGFKQAYFSWDGIYLNAKGRKKLSALIHKNIKMV